MLLVCLIADGSAVPTHLHWLTAVTMVRHQEFNTASDACQ
jgi:hypothetical protein